MKKDDVSPVLLDWVIEQLEAAPCGDNALDYAIARALQPPPGMPCWAYTTSLDAASLLVPEGWGFKADCGLGHGNSFTVGHVGANKLYDMPEGYGEGATPELALCIAALRARQTVPQTVDRTQGSLPNTDTTSKNNPGTTSDGGGDA